MALSFKDVWTLPFVKDPGEMCVYIWDSKSHVCFNYLGNDLDEYNRIVDLLNDKDGVDGFLKVGRDDKCIAVSDNNNDVSAEPCLLVRGWGRLTGIGGLKLDSETAIKMQHDLMDYCVRRLKKYGKDNSSSVQG